jgi:organic radical activating enzyme
MYKISEIFYSLQGEGFYTGTSVIFIRFSGCNLKCSWCDTEHNVYTKYTLEQIYDLIKDFPSKIIVLTGGEPTLQLDRDFISFFKERNYQLNIESNGTKEIPQGIDFITISPKVTLYSDSWKVKHGHELKVVYENQSLEQYFESTFKYRYLQPCSMGNIQETIDQVKKDPRWKLSLQIQKILNIR